MTQEERLHFLLQALLAERPGGQDIAIPRRPEDRRRLLRALMNTRPRTPSPRRCWQSRTPSSRRSWQKKTSPAWPTSPPGAGAVPLARETSPPWRWTPSSTPPTARCWGALSPCHGCIDNAIHSAAGMERGRPVPMPRQGHEEPTGQPSSPRAITFPAGTFCTPWGPSSPAP